MEKFAGHRGIERLYRYSQILKPLRNKGNFPFKFKDEKGLGLYDFAAAHLYQLFRITLLAKTTTPINIDSINVEDYRVVHLTHSQNPETEILQEKHLTHSPGMAKLAGMKLHEAWEEILSDYEKKKFVGAYWDTALKGINDDPLREYLVERYG